MKLAGLSWTAALAAALWPAFVQAQTPPLTDAGRLEIERQLGEIRTMRQDLARQVQALDTRIDALETRLGGRPAATAPAPDIVTLPEARDRAPEPARPGFGAYEPGRGLVLARTDVGELDFSIY